MESIQTILRKHDIMPAELSRVTNLPLASVEEFVAKPVEEWTVGDLSKIAGALAMKPGGLLSRLQDNEDDFELQLDAEQQLVQGVNIADPAIYELVSFVVQNNVMEGWRPTISDVKMLVETAKHPDPTEVARIERIWNEEN